MPIVPRSRISRIGRRRPVSTDLLTENMRSKWLELGGHQSSLGLSMSVEVPFEGGTTASFQQGVMYWWPDTGYIVTNHYISVRYTGMVCYAETSELSASDEPYAAIGVITAHGTSAFATRVYEDVDAGESVPDLTELIYTPPTGITITVLLMEHDEGDPNKYREIVQKGVEKGFSKVKDALPLIPTVGPILAIVGPPILDAIAPIVTETINELLGTGDDNIGECTFYISPKQMVVSAVNPGSFEHGLPFKFASPIMNGDGGSYKDLFDTQAVQL